MIGDALAVDRLKKQKLSWYGLIYMLSPKYSQQDILTSESSEHSAAAATRSAQGACDLYKLQYSNYSDNSATCCSIRQKQ